jgi:hypothetical protein
MRTEIDFYGVWHEGLEWPQLHADLLSARNAAHRLAKIDPGREVHVMKILSQGVVSYSDKPERATGIAA